MKKKIIVIPAYEPDNKLIELLEQIDQKEFDIVVINDGSGTKYKDIFESAKKYAKVLGYEENQGKGYALKVGFQYVLDHYSGEYFVVTMDSDGQHKIDDAKNLCVCCEKNPDLLVLGMRKRDKDVPLRSKLGNEITKFIYTVVTGIDVYDTQTGFRVFSYKLLPLFLSIEGERFEYEMNVLLRCVQEGILIKEIPIQTIYVENNSHSHFHTIKDSYRVYKEIIKFSCSSIISFFLDYLLFVIFCVVIDNIVLSNIFARVISATFNYVVNRILVFKSKNGIKKSFLSYFLLAISILLFNTIILNVLVTKLFFNQFFAKIITEIILFFCSWFVQKHIIFRSRQKF